jgi:O-antigen/teichoic acid export membrane protein
MGSSTNLNHKSPVSATGRDKLKLAVAYFFGESGTLKERAIRGGVWIVLGKGVDQVASFIRLLVLARLLAPDDFGLMGIAMLALSYLEVFSQTGFHAALVQRRGDIRPYLDTVFTVQVVRGVVLMAVVLLAAPWVAAFFKNSAAALVLQVVGLTLLLNGFINPATVFFQRDLSFRKQFYWNATSGVTGLIVAIVFACWYRNVWALVISSLATSLVRVGLSYIVSHHRPRIVWSWTKIKELSGYGRWVYASNVLVYIALNLDGAVVGRVLNTMTLGFYQVAYRLANMPATEVTHLLSTMTFPMYAEVRENREKLRQIFFGAISIATLVGLPLVIGLLVFAQPGVVLVMSDQWLPMVPLLKVLSVYGLLRMVVATGGALFAGLGRPAYDTQMNIWRVVILVILIYPMTAQWGAVGAAWAAVISMAVTIPYWLKRSAMLLQTSPTNIVVHTGKYMLLAAVGCGLPAWGGALVLPLHHWLGLLTGVIGAAGVYGLCCYVAWQRGFIQFTHP